MPDAPSSSTDAVVICTRNRPEELEKTLQSVAVQSGARSRLVLVVDGSNPQEAEATAHVVESWTDDRPFRYHRYQGPPAGTRQRNAGVDLLPASVSIVHFIDDDVILKPEYFCSLSEALSKFPSLLGVGGIICLSHDGGRPSHPTVLWPHRFFLLRTNQPSRVLPSGQTTPAWPVSEKAVQPAEWLSTCASSYQREVLARHRFDPDAEGPSPRLEDLDFSHRVAQDGPLAIIPTAQCVHRRSPRTRRGVRDASRERVVRRYWFVEKNLGTPTHHAAFWWSMLGKLLILLLSTSPKRNEALRGFGEGIRAIWHRDHALLRPDK